MDFYEDIDSQLSSPYMLFSIYLSLTEAYTLKRTKPRPYDRKSGKRSMPWRYGAGDGCCEFHRQRKESINPRRN